MVGAVESIGDHTERAGCKDRFALPETQRRFEFDGGGGHVFCPYGEQPHTKLVTGRTHDGSLGDLVDSAKLDHRESLILGSEDLAERVGDASCELLMRGNQWLDGDALDDALDALIEILDSGEVMQNALVDAQR